MAIRDTFIIEPPIACPDCGRGALEGWEGAHAAAFFFVWQTSQAAPTEHRVTGELRLPPEELAEKRLPDGPLELHGGTCSGCGRGFRAGERTVVADVEGRTWVRTRIVPASPAPRALGDGWYQCPLCGNDAWTDDGRDLRRCRGCEQLIAGRSSPTPLS